MASCHLEWLTLTHGESRGDDRAAVTALLDSLGELFGYPRTAVEAGVAEWAYNRPSLLPNEEQQAIEDESV